MDIKDIQNLSFKDSLFQVFQVLSCEESVIQIGSTYLRTAVLSAQIFLGHLVPKIKNV